MTYKGHSVAAVIPAHNEATHIRDVLLTMAPLVDRVFVVDDGSTDETGTLARSVADERVRVIRHEHAQGVGGAILAGHRLAVEEGMDISVVMAGDGQMNPKYLTRLLDPITDQGYGFTKGNRFFSNEGFAGMPRHRVVGNIALSFATKMASGYWRIFDAQNGYTATTREALERLPLDRIAKGYVFENDVLIHLNIAGVRACDVPIPAQYGTEVSGIRLARFVPAVVWLLFSGFWRRVWRKYVFPSFSPIAMLLFSGLLLTTFGLLVGIYATIYALIRGSPTAGTVVLGVGPVIVGVNLLVQALVLDIQEEPH